MFQTNQFVFLIENSFFKKKEDISLNSVFTCTRTHFIIVLKKTQACLSYALTSLYTIVQLYMMGQVTSRM